MSLLNKFRYENLNKNCKRKLSLSELWHFYRELNRRGKNFSSSMVDWVAHDDLTIQLEAYASKNYIAWLGHASYLIGLNGNNILIDPVFSQRASPFQWVGPKRIVAPPIAAKQLPKIDYILITHNHYDHLDKPYLKSLENKDSIKIICPLGLGKTISRWGFDHVMELGWHDSIVCDSLTFTALPAQHYSSRGLFDKNTSWWCSFAISNDNLRLFHSGDTAYADFFKAIGNTYGPFDYAMIGIGAYKPQAIMKNVHITPLEALKIANDINTQTVLPMHWGTFILSIEEVTVSIRSFTGTRAQCNMVW